MATEITNSDEIIDSRDIIERIEELTGYAYDDVLEFFDGEGLSPDLKLPDPDDEDVLLALVKFADLIDGYTSEFRHGVTLIREDYFETYAEDLARDLGYMSENTSAWPFTHIDWAAAADELKQDYTEYNFDGATYYGRA